MPTPKNLADQIDRAINEWFVNGINVGSKLEGADPIDELVVRALDVNTDENENHIFALLRYPEAAQAVRLLAEVQRGHLINLLGESVEFAHIVEILHESSS